MKSGLRLLLAGAAASAGFAVYAANKLVFAAAKGRLNYNSVWKSKYGDIAFTKAGDGPPLLLIHSIAIGSGSHEWDQNIEMFSKKCTVYAIDLPGFGASDKGKVTYNSYFYTNVINDFIAYVIGKKTDAIALSASCGILLAAAALKPSYYRKIIAVNPFHSGHGGGYSDSGFVKTALPIPVIGTLVYNFISSKQSILSFLDKAAPVTDNFEHVEQLMLKRYISAHKGGSNNKYAVIGYINGFMNTPVSKMINKCPVNRLILLSGGTGYPFDKTDINTGDKKLCITELKDNTYYPNAFSQAEFYEKAESFFENGANHKD